MAERERDVETGDRERRVIVADPAVGAVGVERARQPGPVLHPIEVIRIDREIVMKP